MAKPHSVKWVKYTWMAAFLLCCLGLHEYFSRKLGEHPSPSPKPPKGAHSKADTFLVELGVQAPFQEGHAPHLTTLGVRVGNQTKLLTILKTLIFSCLDSDSPSTAVSNAPVVLSLSSAFNNQAAYVKTAPKPAPPQKITVIKSQQAEAGQGVASENLACGDPVSQQPFQPTAYFQPRFQFRFSLLLFAPLWGFHFSVPNAKGWEASLVLRSFVSPCPRVVSGKKFQTSPFPKCTLWLCLHLYIVQSLCRGNASRLDARDTG